MQFIELGLSEPILRAVRSAGYETTTPIQAQAIPPALEGRDLLGCAQTGTGKTAAFALPILERLAKSPVKGRPIRALIVTPTRELAAQIGDNLEIYARHLPLDSAVIFGGVNQHRQVQTLRRGVEILVATPGRLLDLMSQRHVILDRVEVLVLDEADRMLDMGFINDIRKIIAKVPAKRQTLLFSATMPDEIKRLAGGLLEDPAMVSVAAQATTAENVVQRMHFVAREDKPALLAHLLRDPKMTKTLVFTRTKHGADRVARRLSRDDIEAAAIHGGKSQNARVRALEGFRRGTTRVLVASDIASRGLDIDELSHVVNFDLPNEPETYVHRIGRTGRAGARGIAISFCAHEERGYLRSIEKVARITVPVFSDHPYHAGFEKLAPGAPEPPSLQKQRGNGGGGGGRRGGNGGAGRGGNGGGEARGGDGRRRGGGAAARGPAKRDGGGGAAARGPAKRDGGGGAAARGPAKRDGGGGAAARGPAKRDGGGGAAARGPAKRGPSRGERSTAPAARKQRTRRRD